MRQNGDLVSLQSGYALPARHQIPILTLIDAALSSCLSRYSKLFVELSGAAIVFDDTEAQCEIIGGFLDRAKLDYRHEVSDDLLIAWWFGGAFREMAEKSCHWAILDRQTVFALSSKYSILLFQHIASLVNLDHISSKTFTVAELRAVMGVADGKLATWNDMNKRALSSAIAEINHTSRLILRATPNKIGRTVASVTITWEEKPQEAKRETKHELDSSKVGRKARMEGKAETITSMAFPASGTVRYTKPWEDIARANCNWDLGKLADAFRSFCKGKNIKLDAKNIEDISKNFCAIQPRL